MLHLERGSLITVAGQGSPPENGIGKATSGSGGGHGGYGGGATGGVPYGSYYSPKDPGSGGGSDLFGAGGGSGGSTIEVRSNSSET